LRVIENTKLTQINQIQNIQIEKREETHSYKEAASPAYMEAAASYVHEQGGGKVTNFGGKHSNLIPKASQLSLEAAAFSCHFKPYSRSEYMAYIQ